MLHFFARPLFYALVVADVQQIGLGAALGLAVVALKEVALAAIRRRGRGSTAGEQDPAYWEVTIRHIIEDVLDRRNDTVRTIVREVLQDELRKRGL